MVRFDNRDVGRSTRLRRRPPGRLAMLAGWPGAVAYTLEEMADDPLVRPAGGRSVAAAIPGARLVIIPGMGHDLPPEVWPVIAGELLANARRVPAGEVRAASTETAAVASA